MGFEFKEGENMGIDHVLGFSGFGSSSSSSDLSTLVGSELDSTEVESTDEFMAELTRQMADYMLEDDYVEEKKVVSDLGLENFKFYQLENQPRVANDENIRKGGRRGKRSESTQPEKQMKDFGKSPPNRLNNYGKGYPPYVGSGMRAVFLGGVGSRNASSGTGVFLPRTISTTTNQPCKKSGCSTVLIPTRVLQALEQHFSNVDSLFPSNRHSPLQHGKRDSTQEKGQPQSQLQPPRAAMDHQLSQLPQEWTY